MTVKTKSNEKTTSVISQAILVKILVKILKQFWLKYGFRHQALCIDSLIFASKTRVIKCYISQKNTISIFRLLHTKINASSNKKKCKIDERWLRK